MSKHWKIGLLGLALIPLLGTTCAKEKTIEFLVLGQSEASFQARGSVNVDLGSDEYDLKQDLDLQGIAAEYGVNPQDIKTVTFRQLCVRITKGDVNASDRAVTGTLTIQFKDLALADRAAVGLGSVTDFAAGQTTDWIDITELVTAGGVSEINAFLARCLAELKGGSLATHTIVNYSWGGTSTPTNVDTDFDWDVKIVLNIVPTTTGDFPDF